MTSAAIAAAAAATAAAAAAAAAAAIFWSRAVAKSHSMHCNPGDMCATSPFFSSDQQKKEYYLKNYIFHPASKLLGCQMGHTA